MREPLAIDVSARSPRIEDFVLKWLGALSGDNRFNLQLFPSMALTLEGLVLSKVRDLTLLQGNYVLVESHGQKMMLNLRDKGAVKNFFAGIWGPFQTQLVQRLAIKAGVALDLGAYIGYSTLLIAPLARKVYAFEPEPSNFALLKYNTLLNGLRNVVCVQKAVSDRTGSANLYLSPDYWTCHNIWQNRLEKRARTERVETTSLDDFFRNSTEKIDFIKMDIEGSEWHALNGMRRVLERSERVKLVTEYNPVALAKAGVRPEDYLRLLCENGFVVSEIDEVNKRLVPVPRSHIGNYARISKSTDFLCER